LYRGVKLKKGQGKHPAPTGKKKSNSLCSNGRGGGRARKYYIYSDIWRRHGRWEWLFTKATRELGDG
jgi:hypothetical protein